MGMFDPTFGPKYQQQPTFWDSLASSLAQGAAEYKQSKQADTRLNQEQQSLDLTKRGQDINAADTQSELGLRRAALLPEGIHYDPSQATDQSVTIPTVAGVTTAPVTVPTRTAVGGGYYLNPAETPQARAAALAAYRQRTIADALSGAGVRAPTAAAIAADPSSAGYLIPRARDAIDPNSPEALRNRYRYLEGPLAADRAKATGGANPALPSAERYLEGYDRQTDQTQRAAAGMVPRDPLWRPRTASDSSNVALSDSLRAAAVNRLRNRPSLDQVLKIIGASGGSTDDGSGGGGGTSLPPLTDGQRQRAATDPDYKAFLQSQGYTP